MTTTTKQRDTTKAMATAVSGDQRITGLQGYASVWLVDWLNELLGKGQVEVGWRESCGTTDLTLKVYREWLRVVKALRRAGYDITEERVKHKNGYASNNGGFWNSIIYSVAQ